jgi:hypothetical protein
MQMSESNPEGQQLEADFDNPSVGEMLVPAYLIDLVRLQPPFILGFYLHSCFTFLEWKEDMSCFVLAFSLPNKGLCFIHQFMRKRPNDIDLRRQQFILFSDAKQVLSWLSGPTR